MDIPGEIQPVLNLSAKRADRVLDRLKRSEGNLKKAALKEAATFRTELTPSLLKILERAADSPFDFLNAEDDSYVYATILLAHWEEERALPVLLRFAKLEKELLEDLWGDLLIEIFPTFLYRMGKRHLDTLKTLAADPKASIYFRATALETLNWYVASGIITRDDMLLFYLRNFHSLATRNDPMWMGQLVLAWMDLHPKDDLEEIREAVRAGLLDRAYTGEWEFHEARMLEENPVMALDRIRTEMSRRMPLEVTDYTVWWTDEDQKLREQYEKELFSELDETVLNPMAELTAKLNLSLRFHEIRAYVLGIVMGLEPVPPSQVYGEVLIQENDEEVEFNSDVQARSFFSSIMMLWNEMAGWPQVDEPLVFNRDLIQKASRGSARSKEIALFVRRNEADSFLIGMLETETFPETIRDPEARKVYLWLETYTDRLEALCDDIVRCAPEARSEHLPRIDAILAEGDETWKTGYWLFAHALRKQREAAKHDPNPDLNPGES